MPTTSTTDLLIAFFDGIGEGITPTANFTPPISGDFSLSNLRDSQLFHRTRTPSLFEAILTWDWLTPVEGNIFALIGTNATKDTLRRIRFADNNTFTSGVVESGTTLTPAIDTSLGQTRSIYVPPWGRTLIYTHPTSITKQFLRWHQTDVDNSSGYQEWAIARFGLSMQFPFHEWSTDPRYGSNTDLGGKLLRGHQFTLGNLSKQEAYELENLYMSLLNERRVLVIPEGTATSTYNNDAIWCVFEGVGVRTPVINTAYNTKRYKVSLKFREVER